jgi:site-specific DNA-methyltransferase (adenine-specific)
MIFCCENGDLYFSYGAVLSAMLERVSVTQLKREVSARIFTEDCVTGLAKIEPQSVDVVVTSPPYNIGVGYNRYMDIRDQAEYVEWFATWTRALHRVLKKYGSFFLNLGSSPTNPTVPHNVLYSILEDGNFVLQNTIHWIKSITILDDNGAELSKGHYKPINSDRFINDCHEYIFHLTPTGNTPLDRLAIGVEYKHKSNVTRWERSEGMDRRCRGNAWFIPYKTIQNRRRDRPHPATFPLALPEQCIRLHGNRDAIVLDPFMGVGSTWAAAKRCGVKEFIGFEIDPSYIELAKEYTKNITLVRLDPKMDTPSLFEV